MKKAVAVLGMTVTIQAPFSGSVTVTSIPSTKALVDSKGIYFGELAVTLAGVSGTGITGGSGAGTISPTATKMILDNQAVLRVDDENIAISVSGTLPNPPYSPVSLTVGVKITDAGQTKVLAE